MPGRSSVSAGIPRPLSSDRESRGGPEYVSALYALPWSKITSGGLCWLASYACSAAAPRSFVT